MLARRDHHAAVFGKSMIVYGGQFENGSFSNELLNFDLEYFDWSYITFKQHIEPFSNGACCSVMSVKTKQTLTRLSDTILDGVYFFGGKNAKGELPNKLKFLKPFCAQGKVQSVEW